MKRGKEKFAIPPPKMNDIVAHIVYKTTERASHYKNL